MDRKIEKKPIATKRWISIALVLLAGIAGFYLLRKNLRVKVHPQDLIFSEIKRGDIASSFSATGIIKPRAEVSIVSPMSTKIDKVLIEQGKAVEKSDHILQLATEFASIEYKRLQDELKLKENNVKRLRLNLQKNLRDIEIDNQIQALKIENLSSKLSDLQLLYKVGGTTEEAIKQAQSELEIVRLNKQKLENELNYRKASIDVDVQNETIQSDIQRNILHELGTKIQQTQVVSPINGVLTWVHQTIGAQVTQGTPIARVADLSAFHIIATASDMHAKKIQTGQSVQIIVSKEILRGTVEQILPAVEQGAITFKVALDNPSAPLLRPNMKVEIQVITATKKNVLYAVNGQAYRGGKSQAFFIKDKDKLVRKELSIGISNSKQIEILDGAKEGDQIVINNMERYADNKSINFSH